MYSTKPIGINTKDSDRNVADNFLLESINLQWRDGALRPIPERIVTDINCSGYSNIILHKVGDENQINVLGFNGSNILYWFGTITNGAYAAITPVSLTLVKTSGMSFTILNGLIYFMGDGSSTAEQYYYQFQYNEPTDAYISKNMYAWKSLIHFYPYQTFIALTAPGGTKNVFSQCGLICIRTALVLKSGEVVLHSPIYAFLLFGVNRGSVSFVKGDVIENIHTFINLDFSFADQSLYDSEISAMNIYASVPYYETTFTQEYSGTVEGPELVSSETIIGEIKRQSEQPFYLIKTIEKPNAEKLLLTVGQFDTDLSYSETVSKIDISTIAAGEIMPVDNFSYHSIFGKITSYNGRLIVDSPTTVLSEGHSRALATDDTYSNVGFRIDTEDGKVDGVSYKIDKAISYSASRLRPRGILSYPDRRATFVGGSNELTGAIATSTINSGGADYRLNDILTISGGNTDAKIKATAIKGGIFTETIHTAGTGYVPTEVITITGGDGNATLRVLTVDGLGGVLTYILLTVGTNYVLATNIATTASLAGIGFKLNITEVKGEITAYSVENKGSGYSVLNGVATTVIPAVGTGFKINITGVETSVLRLVKTRKNEFHNMACCFDLYAAGYDAFGITLPTTDISTSSNYNCFLAYTPFEEITSPSIVAAKYNSNNRVQFSDIGEYSVWPAINSYRIGEGKIMGVGSNSINPTDARNIAPLIIGTTDGIYTINIDPSGNNLVASIPKTANTPYVSREVLQIENQLIYISDTGLYAFNDGDPINLSGPFFPDQGNGNYPDNDSVMGNYDLLTTRFFGGAGNPYQLDDIVKYLKGCKLAFDAKRSMIWCSNPNYNFSLIYDIPNKAWGFSTLVFYESSELFSIIATDIGDIYSRHLVRKSGQGNMLILSGEDTETEVDFHLLTRPIKTQYADCYKKISRMFARCELIRSSVDGYFSLGIWGKQDLNKNKIGIPIVAISEGSSTAFPSNVRQDIPIGMQRGKYKGITVSLTGKALPESSINSFDIEAYLVDEKQLR